MKEPESHDHRKSWATRLFGWGVFILLLVSVGVFRYGYHSFLGSPSLVIPASNDELIEISPGGSFVLEFDQLMKRATVEAAIHIDPPVAYQGTWDGRSFFMKPDSVLQEGKTYLVSVKKSAQNILGKPLQRNAIVGFRVGGDPKIVALFPDKSLISSDQKIIILFSRAMVSEQDTGKRASPDFLDLTPTISGDWIWRNSKTLVFTPTGGFHPSSRYHLVSTKPMVTQEATLINGTIDLTFETERLKVVSNADTNEDTVSVRDPFHIMFNQPVDLDSLREHSRLTDASGKAVTDILFTEGAEEGTILLQKKSGSWLYNNDYTLTLTGGLMAQGGNLSLGEEVNLVFHTLPLASGVKKFVSSDPSKVFLVDQSAMIVLQESIDLERFKKAVSLVPAADVLIGTPDGKSFEIHFVKGLSLDQEVKLYLSTALNPDDRQLIAKPISMTIGSPPKLSVEVVDMDDQLCFFSTNDLDTQTSLRRPGEERELWKLITREDTSDCPKRESMSSFVLAKRFLEPGNFVTLRIAAKDVYGQKLTQEIQVKPHPIDVAEIQLATREDSSYRSFSNAEDLKVSFRLANVFAVRVEICKVTADQALRIETSYSKKWSSLTVNPENCLQSKSLTKNVEPMWGEEHEDVVSVAELLDEVTPGLYYVRLVLPGMFDGEGSPIEAGSVIQYSPWDLLSKRGESTLLWITDHAGHQPVRSANVRLYTNDGLLLSAGQTDQDGIFFRKNNKERYGFILAQQGQNEAMLNIFNQEGFEPSRYGLPFHAEESNFRYHFFVENFGDDRDAITGRILIQEQTDHGLIPGHLPVTITLSNAHEELYWKKAESPDGFGMVDFDIQSPYPLLDGVYQLSACIGLFEGVCSGTNLWTNLVINGGDIQDLDPAQTENSSTPDEGRSRLITVSTSGEMKVGDTARLKISGLKSNIPSLVTAERDGTYWYRSIVPQQDSLEIPIPISEEMVPELIVTVTQFGDDKTLYDMISIPVDRSAKAKVFDQAAYEKKSISLSAYRMKSLGSLSSSLLLETLYPRLGTSVVTASSRAIRSTADDSVMEVSAQSEVERDLTVIDGQLLSPDQTLQLIKDDHLMDPASAQVKGSYALLMMDNDGHAQQLAFSDRPVQADLSMSANLPDFIRQGDRLLLPLSINNRGKNNGNFQLSSSGEDIELISNEDLMVGIPQGQVKVVSIATKMPNVTSASTVSLKFAISEGGTESAVFNGQIPVASIRHPMVKKKLVIMQSAEGSGELEMPIKSTGTFVRTVTVSPSPVAFVLENLKSLLRRESFTYEEEFFKKITAENYLKLMQASLESDQEFSSILQQKNTMENELFYLASQQKADGGWSPNASEVAADPSYTAGIARSLALVEQLHLNLPEGLRTKVISYLKNQLEKVSAPKPGTEDDLQQFLLLNALSSLTPSGVTLANYLYGESDKLSSGELVLLLMTFEDFRDAGVKSMNYKVEELTQLLKAHQQKLQDEIWLDGGADSRISNFTLTSWYLEALVRQASARSDIAGVITWLVRNKFRDEVQTSKDQCAYLEAMASYFRIFHEEIQAHTLSLDLGTMPGHDFAVDPGKPFQSFVIRDVFSRDDAQDDPPVLKFSADTQQSWFIEIDWSSQDQETRNFSNGISVTRELDSPDVLITGQTVSGSISIISPVARDEVIVTLPMIAGARELGDIAFDDGWKTRSFGKDEKWFILDHIDAGETIIPFHLLLQSAGIFSAPPVSVWVSGQPEISAQSDSAVVEIRSLNQ